MILAYCIIQANEKYSFRRVFENMELSSLDQANRLIPDGVYTTFRTYEKFYVLDLEGHFDRLEQSARLIQREVKLNRIEIRRVLRKLIENFPAQEARVRISIPLVLDDTRKIEIYIFLENLIVPSLQDYQKGVRVITMRMQRENPNAKTTSFIHAADEIRQKLPKGINEVVMVGENGRMLEGLSSNFFAVKGGVVYTDDGHGLAGITRKHVLEIVRELKIPCTLEGVLYTDVPILEEAFITSTSRGVLPVCQIDDQIIGQGNAGKFTRIIMQQYQEKIKRMAEPI